MGRRVLPSVTLVLSLGLLGGVAQPTSTPLAVTTPMAAPAWALAERALIEANAAGVQAYADRVLDARGYMPVEPRWGVNDGPDDLMENIRNWPLAHAIGGADTIIDTWQKAWEGHLEQFTRAKIPSLDITRDGIYYKEFTPQFDWEHISEGFGPFYFYGLSRPTDTRYQARMRRFAGLYMNEDPEAPNFDPKHMIVRSLFNGSKGPKLTPATVDEWDGPLQPGADPNAPNRTRFATSSNVRGDHPLNLNVAMLHFHAYLLTGEVKYRDWLLHYVNAWRARTEQNGGNIPSNIGLDGTIGGEWGGKWYGGVFGWNSPDSGVRNYVLRGPPEAFGAALLLTGDQRYPQVLRRQIDNLFAASKEENGKRLLPRFYGDQGWYGFHEVGAGPSGSLGNLHNVLIDLYMWSLAPGDRARAPDNAWLEYLQSGDASYPLRAFHDGLDDVRRAGARLRGEIQGRGGAAGGRGAARSAPPVTANPVATTALINLTMGANDPGGSTHGPLPLHAQVRYFDPDRRRAGLPEDVAALVHGIQPGQVSLTLVNLHPLQFRSVVVQMGAYGEHHATTVRIDGRSVAVDGPSLTVRLSPGAGGALDIGVRRYEYDPTLSFPWDRGAVVRPRAGGKPARGR